MYTIDLEELKIEIPMFSFACGSLKRKTEDKTSDTSKKTHTEHKPREPLKLSVNSNVFENFKDVYIDFDDIRHPQPELKVLRQREAKWFDERKNRLTASKLPQILGFFNGFLKSFDSTYNDKEDKFDALQQERMDWGTQNELNGLATFYKFVLEHANEKQEPKLYETTIANIKWSESQQNLILKTLKTLDPSITELTEDWKKFLLATPDGLLRFKKSEEQIEQTWVEIKCPYGMRRPKLYDNVPWYYFPQLQLQLMIDRPITNFLYFVCWTPTRTRIWKVYKDFSVWNLILPRLVEVHYCGINKKMPKPDRDRVKKIIAHCKRQVEDSTELLDEIDSWSLPKGPAKGHAVP